MPRREDMSEDERRDLWVRLMGWDLKPSPTGRRLYKHRWVMAVLVFLINMGPGLPFAFSSVIPSMSTFYEVDDFAINVFGLIAMIAYIPAAVVSGLVMQKSGLRLSCLCAGGLTLVGGVLFFAANFPDSRATSYVLALLGQIFVSLAQPFSMNASTKVAAEFFSENERTTANTIAALGTPVGIGMNFLLSPAFVDNVPSNVRTLNVFIFGFSIWVAFLSLLVANRPPTPPTPSSEEAKISFWRGLAQCFLSNRQFVVLTIVFGLTVGTFGTMETFLSDLLVPYGFTESDAGTAGGIFIGCGVLVAAVNGVIQDRIKAHRTALRILAAIAIVGMGLVAVGMHTQSGAVVFLGAALYGGGGFPTMPLAMEMGAECTFPVDEGTSTAILQSSGTFVSIILILVVSALRKPDKTLLNGAILMVCAHAAALVFAMLYHGGTRRSAMDEREEGPALDKKPSSAGRVAAEELSLTTVVDMSG